MSYAYRACSTLYLVFGCILDHLVALQNSVQNGPNWCKSSCHEVASEFTATNVPDPPHWIQNSCFCAFRTIWLSYETRCKTGRTSAKIRATKSRRNFSQGTHPIHPIRPYTQNFGVYRTIWVHLGPFGCLT